MDGMVGKKEIYSFIKNYQQSTHTLNKRMKQKTNENTKINTKLPFACSGFLKFPLFH